MAAHLLGTTGNWGIPNDQSGILITDLSFDYSHQEKIEIKMSGLVAKTSPFNGRIGVALALANTAPAHLQNSGGTTVLMQVSRSLNAEDFEKIDLTAVHYPAVSSGA